MMQRVPRYPPDNARLVRLEEGPPMYRMLGYADKNNQHSDLCDPPPPGYMGGFSMPRLHPNQTYHFGTGVFGLPSHPLAYTTVYWDENFMNGCNIYCHQSRYLLMHDDLEPYNRPVATIFPERAVPGTGVHSKFVNSGYRHIPRVHPPHITTCGDRIPWFETPVD